MSGTSPSALLPHCTVVGRSVAVAGRRAEPVPGPGARAPDDEVALAVAIHVGHERDVSGRLRAPLFRARAGVGARRGRPVEGAGRGAPDGEVVRRVAIGVGTDHGGRPAEERLALPRRVDAHRGGARPRTVAAPAGERVAGVRRRGQRDAGGRSEVLGARGLRPAARDRGTADETVHRLCDRDDVIRVRAVEWRQPGHRRIEPHAAVHRRVAVLAVLFEVGGKAHDRAVGGDHQLVDVEPPARLTA